MEAVDEVTQVLELIRNMQGSWDCEERLQSLIGSTIETELPIEREVILSKRDRIDFVAGESKSIGIEVKVDGSYTRTASQLLRYCEHESLETIVLVTTVPSHLKLRGMRNGRGIPVYVCYVALNGI